MTAPPLSGDRLDRSGDTPIVDWLLALALVAVAGTYVRAVFFTPPELLQGVAQKILYLHVPAWIAAYLAFYLTMLMSVTYLWLRDSRMDRLAEASGEVALVFTTVALIAGSLWAKPIWGAWWTWDVRLTSALFLWFLGIGYNVVRTTFDDESMRARYSAVLSIMAGLLIPFVHLSVYLFRHQHPDPMILTPPGSGSPLPPEMNHTLLLAMASFTLLCIALIRARYTLGAQREALAALEGRA